QSETRPIRKNASIPGQRILLGTNRSQWRRAGTTTTCSAGKRRTGKKTAPILPYLLHSRKRERNRSVWERAARKNCLRSLLPNYFSWLPGRKASPNRRQRQDL